MKKLIFILLIIIVQNSYSQWEKTSWKSTAQTRKVYISDSIVIINYVDDGISISKDYGETFEKCKSLYDDVAPNTMAMQGNNIYIGGFTYFYVSTDLGNTWKNINYVLNNCAMVYNIITIDNNIIVGCSNGLYFSSDNGNTWIEKDNGITITKNIVGLFNYKNKVFASTYDSVYLSTDMGETWVSKNNGLHQYYTYSKFSNIDSIIFISSSNYYEDGYNNKIYMTTDYGDNWIEKNNTPIYKSSPYYLLATTGNRVLIYCDSLCYSTDYGTTWYTRTDSLPMQLQHGIDCLWTQDSVLYASSGSELYYSTDYGDTWNPIITTLNYGIVCTLTKNGNTIFAGAGPEATNNTYLDGIYTSTDYGNTWKPSGLEGYWVIDIYTNSNNVYSITNNGNYLSTDLGKTWQANNVGFPDSSEIWSMAFYGNKIFTATGEKGVMLSTDMGNTWSARNNGLPVPKHEVMSLKFDNNILYVGLDSSFFISTDFGENWQERRGNLPDTNLMIWQIETYQNNIYIVTQLGIFHSSDLGNNWSNISSSLPKWYWNYKDYYKCKILLYNNNIFATIYSSNGGVFISTDNGVKWIAKNDGIKTRNDYGIINSIVIVSDYAFIGTMVLGVTGEYGNAIYKAKLNDVLTDVEEESQLSNHSTIFPNPASDNLTISIPNNYINNKIEIINLLGIKVLESEPQGQTRTINIESLSKGVYYLKIGNETKIFIKE